MKKSSALLVLMLMVSACANDVPVVQKQTIIKPKPKPKPKAKVRKDVKKVSKKQIDNKYITMKESCVLQSEHRNADQDQLKMILMEQVKKDAVEELFGTMLKSDTLIVNGKLVSDKIKQVAVGNVRIKGNPSFYNGKNFGEVCTKVEAYITEDDFMKYQPKTISVKNFCYNNPNIPLKNLKSEAEFSAYKKAIVKFKPSMKNISNEQAESYIHGFSKINEKLDIQTGVLCMDFSAKLFPYELELGAVIGKHKKRSNTKSKSNTKNGLLVTFYESTDYAFENPIYETTITQDLSLFGKVFTNNKLQKDRAYYIRIKGFIYANISRYVNYQLKADVYNAEVKINNKKVVSTTDTRGGVALKAGLNPIEIIVTSSNSYDVKLLEKQGNGVFKALSVSKLFIKE